MDLLKTAKGTSGRATGKMWMYFFLLKEADEQIEVVSCTKEFLTSEGFAHSPPRHELES